MKRIIIILLFNITAMLSFAQKHWTFELHGGQVYNLPMPLFVKQSGFPVIRLNARFDTEGFTLPVYWDMRLGRWQNEHLWEVELIHHKLYLHNTTPEVQKFNISHGFNMIMVNRGFEKNSFRYRAGAGVVLAHPESIIRGKEFGNSAEDLDMGYFLTGPVLNLSVGRPIHLLKRVYLNPEVKTTFAYSKIKISDGYAHVYNLAFHLILGFGVEINKSTEK